VTVRLLLVDNYDSFTYNLAQAFQKTGAEVFVRRNDAITVDEALALAPTHVCISPGPGRPEDAGVSLEMIRAFVPRTPLLGVCLGHQGLAAAFGADVVRAPRLMHGKSSPCFHDGTGIFAGLPNPLEVGRYHSLIVRGDTLPAFLRVVATTSEGEVMAIAHTSRPTFGVQFHPESVLTPDGEELLGNFLATTNETVTV
jgi:anthranilate synthase/aminodeoxychorismate synthase-like glutamine amidotransferase